VKETCDKCLTAILNCLDIEMRLIYIFRDIAELPYDEIAKVMNKDENNIRKIISRARKRLRNFLNDECALVCTSTQCKCRMKSWVEKVNLKDEYNKIRASVSRINLYKASQKVLPQKNYWKELIK